MFAIIALNKHGSRFAIVNARDQLQRVGSPVANGYAVQSQLQECLFELLAVRSNKYFLLGLLLLTSSLFMPLDSAGQAPALPERSVNGAKVIHVGPQRQIKTLAQASRQVKDGDTVEVDAGDYAGDVAVWSKNKLNIRAIGGRVRLIAKGAAAEGKGIWVVRAQDLSVEGFEFSGATVPDHNGAGIRFEKGSMTVRDCIFVGNENGILTSNDPALVLKIENSEFSHNGYGDGLTHNLYVGSIARLSVSGSYFHHARVGHLLKSRAAVNHIFYNRLTDEIGGQASYELEFANGGIAFVVGNIIQQGSQTENPTIVSYGSEDYKWPRNELYLVNNTLVDNRPQNGVFLRVRPGSVVVRAVNNLLVGKGQLDSAAPGDYRNNINVDWDQFELAAREDYRLKRDSKLLGGEVDAGAANGQSLMPQMEYHHPRSTVRLTEAARHPGALQSVK
jgi:hypothetical protein